MIEQAIYLLITVFIPLKSTYQSARTNNSEGTKLWAVYWSIYFAFKSLQWSCWLFQYRPVDFVFLLLAVWMYNSSYKGALFIADFLTTTIKKVPAVANVIKTIHQKAKFIPLFEQGINFQAKPKSE